MESLSSSPEELKYLILNTKEPVILPQFLKWPLLNWDLAKWNQILSDQELTFRCGRNAWTKEPQWERSTKIVNTIFSRFLNNCRENTEEWMYFDYKYLKEWLNSNVELRQNLDWSFLGFPDVTVDDSTLWIGSKGAHTPCHIDTYGCNIIAQIYGRKQWLVFPPEENLSPTRVPYEESSIYSKHNFFTPSPDLFKKINNCRKIVLNPGDILVLPHKWWHYVENLEISISINAWLPLPEDDQERLSESIVQYFVSQSCKDLNDDARNELLNPNFDQIVAEADFASTVNLIDACKDICRNKASCRKKPRLEAGKKEFSITEILDKHPFIQKIPVLTSMEFQQFLTNQNARFKPFSDKELDVTTKNSETNKIINLINSFTHPDVIDLITQKLLLPE